MVRNLKYLKEDIENYFNSHKMINDVKFGDTDNLSTYLDLNYPVMNFEYLDSNYRAKNSNTSRFQFYIMDLSDEENDFDVVDNMNEIANDYLKYLENHDDIEMSPNVSIVPFSDSFGDRVSGVAFTVTFNVFRNNCSFL